MVVAGSADGTVVLADGRRLGYRLRGPADGHVLVYLHGAPGSRVEGSYFTDDELRAAGVSMLALDRPGIGLSSPVSEVDVNARAEEVIEVCDRHGLGRFVVCGMSGGVIYALAVSALAPERVAAAITISGQARMDTPWALGGMSADVAADWAPGEWTAEDIEANRRENEEEVAALGAPAPEALVAWESMVEGLPADEIAFVRIAGDVFVEDGHEVARQGGQGYWIDGEARALPWPFSATDLSMPVHVFHGAADTWAPCQTLLRDLEGAPHLTTTLYEGGHHLSPLITAERRMAILEAARSALD